MIANGLTKALSRSEFHKFLQQVNLVNIASQIVEREIRESKQEELNHNSLQVDSYGGYYIKFVALPSASAKGVSIYCRTAGD